MDDRHGLDDGTLAGLRRALLLERPSSFDGAPDYPHGPIWLQRVVDA
ncbi:MAG: hypothetical protein H6667_22130 [Ardenticatenaceae bacterium]|nr:hypothetical protein [Ardenticatenaceae bacterium]